MPVLSQTIHGCIGHGYCRKYCTLITSKVEHPPYINSSPNHIGAPKRNRKHGRVGSCPTGSADENHEVLQLELHFTGSLVDREGYRSYKGQG